ncbi:siderophore-interacting protein [Umezawaea endophytica]|uniref:Siderophore-interacting protein n=1 Tax=Umezawaea endophytica TaxID=1654476 RepID=A0A9X2VVF0_9PSEU|nr:siderophore-interacting protein [Umezawaea endophytica]MCS7482917.1 siderophore-interacting protein [Umezawaea endophytica]
MKSRLLDRLLVAAQVHATESLGPRLRLVTLTGPDLAGLDWLPGQHVRLQVAAGPAAVDWLVGTLRTYTVWSYHDQTMQLVVFDHGDGPGAHWARTTRPGDELLMMKPQGSFVTTPAPYHLFAGEETAQAAYGPMLRALPTDARAFGVLEVDSPEERLELGPGTNLEWIYRQGRSAASSETLVEAVRGLELPAEPGRAYLAGEARTIQLVRRHLVEERNWPRRNVLTKPFWTPGRKGMD